MNSLRTLVLACSVLSAATLSAQTSVYAVGGYSRWGYDMNHQGNYTQNHGVADVGGGLFYNFPIQSRVTVGIDGRVLGSPGDDGGLLAGAALRVGFVPHRNPLRPFVQIGGGFVHTSYPYFTESLSPSPGVRRSISSGALQLNFGLDIRLTDSLDLRAPEYGAQAGGSAAGAFLNGGLVFHLRPRS